MKLGELNGANGTFIGESDYINAVQTKVNDKIVYFIPFKNKRKRRPTEIKPELERMIMNNCTKKELTEKFNIPISKLNNFLTAEYKTSKLVDIVGLIKNKLI